VAGKMPALPGFEPGVIVLACLIASASHPGHMYLGLDMVQGVRVK
jgi:hypothetical protein